MKLTATGQAIVNSGVVAIADTLRRKIALDRVTIGECELLAALADEPLRSMALAEVERLRAAADKIEADLARVGL